jgi:DNA-binding beta-propeller fold protein YncE
LASLWAAALTGAALLVAPAQAMPETAIVLNSDEASISIVDRRMMSEIERIPVGREPHHLILTPDGKDLVVASTLTNELLFLDPVTGRERRRIRNILDPYQLGFSPDGKWFVTAAHRMNHVDVYDARDFRLVKRLPLHTLPSHLAFSADSNFVYFTVQGSNQVAALDLIQQEIAWTVDVGEAPAGILVLPDQKRLLVGLTGDSVVVVVDIAQRGITKRVFTGKGAHNIFRMPNDDKRVLITNRVDGSMSIFDLDRLEVAETIKVGGGPDDVDFSPDGRMVWVTQRWRRRVAAVDLVIRRVVGSVIVGRSPHGIYINGPNTVSRSVLPPPERSDATAAKR